MVSVRERIARRVVPGRLDSTDAIACEQVEFVRAVSGMFGWPNNLLLDVCSGVRGCDELVLNRDQSS